MGADANHRSRHAGRHTVGCLSIDQRFQPPAKLSMTWRIPAKGVQQDVDIRENHLRSSIISRSAAESSRFTPGRRSPAARDASSEEHTSELQSPYDLVC